ncbi:MAG: Nif3-like dinuclear metal center hexameric protein [Spirochaetes bacterium]|nr:Nif3-like dinuclear metal center hexameric protein [Spirochaetota bacterium]
MKISEICTVLDRLYLFGAQEEYDNSGPQILFEDETAGNILIALDIDAAVLEEAVVKKCNLVITHHPLIFNPLKSINYSDKHGRLIAELVLNKISVISVHTCLDRKYPLFLGELLGFRNQTVFEPEISSDARGYGSIGYLSGKTVFSEFLKHMKTRLNSDYILYSGDESRLINKAVIINGSGSSFLKKSADLNADLLITADMKFHNAKEAELYGICLADIGHYDSEKMFKKIIKNDLHEHTKLDDCSIILSDEEKNPIKVYLEM